MKACRFSSNILALLLLTASTHVISGETPWGRAKARDFEYKPPKVVYDVSHNTVGAVQSVLDRASYLSTLTGADPFDSSIVLVLHGADIKYFAIENYEKYKELVDRAQSLTVGETIKMRMCQIAAKGMGFDPEDIHGFIEMVPMGDAEIIRLQAEERHAYMR